MHMYNIILLDFKHIIFNFIIFNLLKLKIKFKNVLNKSSQR